jgi:transcription elongation factor GreA
LKEVLLTPEGFEKLTLELEILRTDKRREVADRIRIAREFGDIAENAEYDDAKNEQALLEHRIALLEERLRDAKVINKKDVAKDVVSVGSKVKLRDVTAKQTVEYYIVGSAEANPAQNKLSNESPVGKAILGHKKGEVVEVAAPRGAATSTVSPFLWPMIALPTGDSLESLFSAGFASAEPTMWYSTVSLAATSRSFTFEPTETTSFAMSFFEMTRASRMRSSSVAMRCSSSICSFLASSYSAFSAMSPNSRAMRIRSATSRRLVVESSSISRLSFS